MILEKILLEVANKFIPKNCFGPTLNLIIKRKCLALNKDYPNADAHDQRKLDPKASLVDVVLIIVYLPHLIEQIERNANKYD